MLEYNCNHCGSTHRLMSLIEYPVPDVVSNISSGKLHKELNVIGKNMFLIDRSYAVVQVDLVIDIIDYDDELTCLVWVKILKNELKRHLMNKESQKTLKIRGVLMHDILFYKDSKLINVALDEHMNVIELFKDGELNYNFVNGILLEDYKYYLCRIFNS